MASVLAQMSGGARCTEIFELAGLSHYLTDPPQILVDEAEAAALFRAVEEALGPALAAEMLRLAGRATANYVLAHRIPKMAQALLRHLPAFAARRLLLLAIAKHAWTFAGSGEVSCRFGPHLRMDIARNPLATPSGDWHAAVLDRLFEVLVVEPTNVKHTACAVGGVRTCRFEIRPRYAERNQMPATQAASSRHSPIAPSTASAGTGRLNR